MQQNNQQQNNSYKPRINGYIRSDKVQLIGSNGDNLGVFSLVEAIKLAKDEGMDLIEINSKVVPVIAKIGDIGKITYDKKKKEKEAKKKQKSSEQKEIQFSVNIDEHDIGHKMEKAKEFLLAGNRVRLLVKFKGHELVHTELGVEKLDLCLEMLKDLITLPAPRPVLEGRDMSLIVSPKSSK